MNNKLILAAEHKLVLFIPALTSFQFCAVKACDYSLLVGWSFYQICKKVQILPEVQKFYELTQEIR